MKLYNHCFLNHKSSSYCASGCQMWFVAAKRFRLKKQLLALLNVVIWFCILRDQYMFLHYSIFNIKFVKNIFMMNIYLRCLVGELTMVCQFVWLIIAFFVFVINLSFMKTEQMPLWTSLKDNTSNLWLQWKDNCHGVNISDKYKEACRICDFLVGIYISGIVCK